MQYSRGPHGTNPNFPDEGEYFGSLTHPRVGGKFEPHGLTRAELTTLIARVLERSSMVHPSVETLPTAKSLAKLVPERRPIAEVECYLELLNIYGCDSRREARYVTKDFFHGSRNAILSGLVDPVDVLRFGTQTRTTGEQRISTELRVMEPDELRTLGAALIAYAGETKGRDLLEKAARSEYPDYWLREGLMGRLCRICAHRDFVPGSVRVFEARQIVKSSQLGEAYAHRAPHPKSVKRNSIGVRSNFYSHTGRHQVGTSIDRHDDGSFTIRYPTNSSSARERGMNYLASVSLLSKMRNAQATEKQLSLLPEFVSRTGLKSWIVLTYLDSQFESMGLSGVTQVMGNNLSNPWSVIAKCTSPANAPDQKLSVAARDALNTASTTLLDTIAEIHPYTIEVNVDVQGKLTVKGMSEAASAEIQHFINRVVRAELLTLSGLKNARTETGMFIARAGGAISSEESDAFLAELAKLDVEPDKIGIPEMVERVRRADSQQRDSAKQDLSCFIDLCIAAGASNEVLTHHHAGLRNLAHLVSAGEVERTQAIRSILRLRKIYAGEQWQQFDELVLGLDHSSRSVKALEAFAQLAGQGMERGAEKSLVLPAARILAHDVGNERITLESAAESMEKLLVAIHSEAELLVMYPKKAWSRFHELLVDPTALTNLAELSEAAQTKGADRSLALAAARILAPELKKGRLDLPDAISRVEMLASTIHSPEELKIIVNGSQWRDLQRLITDHHGLQIISRLVEAGSQHGAKRSLCIRGASILAPRVRDGSWTAAKASESMCLLGECLHSDAELEVIFAGGKWKDFDALIADPEALQCISSITKAGEKGGAERPFALRAARTLAKQVVEGNLSLESALSHIQRLAKITPSLDEYGSSPKANSKDFDDLVVNTLAIDSLGQILQRGLEQGKARSLVLPGAVILAKHVGNDSITLDVALNNMEVLARSDYGLNAFRAFWENADDIQPDITVERVNYQLTRTFTLQNILGRLADPLLKKADELRVLSSHLAEFVRLHPDTSATEANQTDFRELLRHHLMVRLARGEMSTKDQTATEMLSSFTIGAPPFSMNAQRERARAHFSEVLAVMYQAFERYYGASSYTFAAKRIPGESTNLIADFGRECARAVSMVNCSSNDQFPGPGLVVTGLRLANVFPQVIGSESDPNRQVKEAWPWAAHVLEDVEKSHMIYLRGMRAVVPPKRDEYCIGGTHYALVTLNEHFEDPERIGVFLVDSTVLSEALGPALIPAGEFRGFDPDAAADIVKQPIRFRDLEAASKERGANILRLTWMSNATSLANAFPVGSDPYHAWENVLERYHTRDGVGHVHTSHITGRYLSSMTPEMDRLLEPIRQAHDEVRDLADRLFTVENIFRLSRALFHKGLTSPDGLTLDEDQTGQDEGQGDIDFFFPRRATRMLEVAKAWHNGLRSRGVQDRNAYPVLVVAKALDDWNRIESPLILDSYDLTLRENGGFEYTFDAEPGIQENDEATWAQRVWYPFARRSELDFRLVDRRQL